MAEYRASRGVPLPSIWQVIAISAALVAAWLVWSRYGRILEDSDDDQFVGSPVKSLHAVESHLKQGDAAIPELLAGLDSTDPKERSQAAYGLGRIGPAAVTALEKVRERLADENPQVRMYAAYAVAHIESDKQAITVAISPLLADADQSVREGVGKELLEIGSPTLSSILAVLSNEQATVRLNVVRVLRSTRDPGNYRGWAGLHAKISQAVHDILKDPDPGVRVEALTVLAEWNQVTVAEVGELLQNDDEQRVCVALQAVAHLKKQAAELVPDIVNLIDKFKLEGVRSGRNRGIDGRLQAILAALSSMKTAARPAVPRLLKVIEKSNDRSRISIAQTLADIGADPDDIVRILGPLLLQEKRHRSLAFQAGELIVKVSPAGARRQVSLLIPRLMVDKASVDESVLYALHALGPQAQEAVPALTSVLQNSNAWAAEFAAITLGQTGLPGVKAAPDLARIISNGGRPLMQRLSCANALASMGAGARSTVPALLQVIGQSEPTSPLPATPDDNTEWHVRAAIIHALGQIGGNDAGVVPALRTQLKSKSYHVRAAAAEALGYVAGTSAEVLAELIRRLRDDDPMVRAQAALAISRMTVDRSKAVAPLMIALADEHHTVGSAAAVALGNIGSAAWEALPVLRECMAQPQVLAGIFRAEPLNIPELNLLPFETAVRTAIKAIEGKSRKDAR